MTIRFPSVYRIYDGTGRLLYIGSSIHVLSRLAGLQNLHAEVMRNATRVEIEHHATIAEARAAEGLAIFNEQPLHNQAGKLSLSLPSHYTDPGRTDERPLPDFDVAS
jgi:hypothetical protein